MMQTTTTKYIYSSHNKSTQIADDNTNIITTMCRITEPGQCCPPLEDLATARCATTMQPEKGVTFKPTVNIRVYTPVVKGEKRDMYYSKEELTMIRLEAMAACTLAKELKRKAEAKDNEYILPLHRDDDDNRDSPRGLEQCMYPRRKRNKFLAMRSILKYQAHLNSRPDMTPEEKRRKLAVASAKLNMWSSIVAVQTAAFDTERAYPAKRRRIER